MCDDYGLAGGDVRPWSTTLYSQLSLSTYIWCISYCFVTTIKHHDQKKEFILAYGSRGVRVHLVIKHGSQQQAWQLSRKLSSYTQLQTQAESANENTWGCVTSDPAPSDVLLSARLHTLNFPKQCQQLGIQCSNAWAYGNFYHSEHHTWVPGTKLRYPVLHGKYL